MTSTVQRKLAHFLAMLAIALQVFLPGSMAVAESNSVDVSRFLCASSGNMSPQAQAAAETVAKLLGEDIPDRQLHGGHCPLCTTPCYGPLPEPINIGAPPAYSRENFSVRFEPGLIREAQGPPLGSRGPPNLI